LSTINFNCVSVYYTSGPPPSALLTIHFSSLSSALWCIVESGCPANYHLWLIRQT